MHNNFEGHTAPLRDDDLSQRPGTVDWRSALLGAAVGVSGPAYFGTLITDATLWVFTGQGRSVREAYAYIGQYSVTVPAVLNFVAEALCAFGCGWVSAAYGKGRAMTQGLAAGLLATSFYLVMLASPETPTMSFVLAAVPLLVTMLGSVIGAWVFSRRSPD